MTNLFGYHVEPNFDPAKEKRRTQVGRSLIGVLIAAIAYDIAGLPFATQFFQVLLASALFYGLAFYFERGRYLRTWWLRKAIIATVPLHLLYLALLFYADKAIPELMTRALGFMPVLLVGAGIEHSLAVVIIKRFEPSDDQVDAAARR